MCCACVTLAVVISVFVYICALNSNIYESFAYAHTVVVGNIFFACFHDIGVGSTQKIKKLKCSRCMKSENQMRKIRIGKTN